jgi:hypothetical protein
MKNVKKEVREGAIRAYLGEMGIKGMDIVRYSRGMVGLNQASAWVRKLKRGEDFSSPVLLMLYYMVSYERLVDRICELPDKEAIMKNVRSFPYEVVEQSDIDVPLKDNNGKHLIDFINTIPEKESNEVRLDRLEREFKEKLADVKAKLDVLMNGF